MPEKEYVMNVDLFFHVYDDETPEEMKERILRDILSLTDCHDLQSPNEPEEMNDNTN